MRQQQLAVRAHPLAAALSAVLGQLLPLATVLLVQIAVPAAWPWVRGGALLARGGSLRRCGERFAGAHGASWARVLSLPLLVLEPLQGPALFFAVASPLLYRLNQPMCVPRLLNVRLHPRAR